MLKPYRAEMLSKLTSLIEEKQNWIRTRPQDFKEFPEDVPMIDIRLCVERAAEGAFNWSFHTGPADFDQRHTRYCGAAAISLQTVPEPLLNELLEQVETQIFDEMGIGSEVQP